MDSIYIYTVYIGDTDSLFVYLPGRTKEEAFRIGSEISAYISELSPAGVVLKLEKVYMGSVMVTKKRYVGNSYENVTQLQPHFDAKGIECIRRDQCIATAKIQEKALRLLFNTNGDLSVIKEYLCSEWYKIECGVNRVSLQDFIFNKAVKLGHYANPSSYPPGATVALKQMMIDPYSYPVYKWRVPYVVVYGVNQASKLRDLVVTPEELLRRSNTNVLSLNSRYYITKCINAALIRVLNICGADVQSWYIHMSPHAMSKQRRVVLYPEPLIPTKPAYLPSAQLHPNTGSGNKSSHPLVQTSILRYSSKNNCDICGSTAVTSSSTNKSIQLNSNSSLCHECKYINPPKYSYLSMLTRLNALKAADAQLQYICQHCVHHTSPQTIECFKKGELLGSDCCQSLDCPVFYKRFALVIRIEDVEYCM